KVYKTIKARYLWNLICEAAWKSAEPGIVFMERYNKQYNNWYWNTVNCTNPCGEEGLPSWGVCNLSSLNLSAFIKNYSVDRAGEMDYKSLAEHAKIGVRLQDNVINIDSYAFPQIREVQLNGERRIGLGTMGLGDALIKMHLRYGSEDALKVVEKIFKTIRDAAYEASTELAKEKGAFPKFNSLKYLKGYFIKKLPDQIRTKIKKNGIRNSLLLQEAPTGSTSLLAGVSSGIEPIYEFEFTRRDRLGEHKIYHPLYKEWKAAYPDTKRPDYFVSANDLSPEDHVKVQGTIQKYVDASISKTVNAPKTHTVEDVKKLYELAYEYGCKGIAYMREGSREGVLTREETKKEEAVPVIAPANSVIPRPYMVQGSTYLTETPVGKTYVTINHDINEEPFEVFITVGKSGSDVAAMADALGRMISLNLRLNGQLPPRERIKKVVAQLIGIGGTKSVGFGGNKVRSLPDAVAKVLSTHFSFAVNGVVEDKHKHTNGNGNNHNGVSNGHFKIKADAPAEKKEEIVILEQLTLQTPSGNLSTDGLSTGLFDICPECGSGSLAYEEGCRKCYSCGYSEC
ncbi:MAG: ribonucleoside-diphosphate reductase, adenosylcobalamin-dependent, partial [Candidatus Levybacteria bacterium CG_4_10_14_0_2_um_filter_35_8]